MGIILKGIGAIMGLFILLVLFGAFVGPHSTPTPAVTPAPSKPIDTKSLTQNKIHKFIL